MQRSLTWHRTRTRTRRSKRGLLRWWIMDKVWSIQALALFLMTRLLLQTTKNSTSQLQHQVSNLIPSSMAISLLREIPCYIALAWSPGNSQHPVFRLIVFSMESLLVYHPPSHRPRTGRLQLPAPRLNLHYHSDWVIRRPYCGVSPTGDDVGHGIHYSHTARSSCHFDSHPFAKTGEEPGKKPTNQTVVRPSFRTSWTSFLPLGLPTCVPHHRIRSLQTIKQ